MGEHATFKARGETRISVQRQLSLFDTEAAVSPALHVSMGYYYELLTAALFGGRCQNNIYREDDESLTKPDVINSKNQIFESKANRTGHQLLLLDGQMDRYKYLQLQKPWPRIYFAIYRHQIKGIKSYKGTEMDVWRALASHTVLGVIIPFSIVHQLHVLSEEDELQYLVKYYASWAYQCARVRSPTVNAFFSEPQVILGALRLDPEKYHWRKWVTPRIEINGIRVQKFPFVLLEDTDHKEWADSFASQYPSEVSEVPF